MSPYPRDLAPAEISPGLSHLVWSLARRMLAGHAPQHSALRAQLDTARLSHITLTGAGLYAHFAHAPGTPRVSPPEMIGGDVRMEVATLDAPAGSLLKVSDGVLDFVEIYTFGEVGWPDEPQVTAFGEAMPLPIPGWAT